MAGFPSGKAMGSPGEGALRNNTWMNEMDNALSVLGLQLVKGKPVKLTKDKKTALAVWSVKFALMLQLVYPRGSRFVIPEADYQQFYDDRQPKLGGAGDGLGRRAGLWCRRRCRRGL
jgi:hypothetical protein